jgi:hypothetical protein
MRMAKWRAEEAERQGTRTGTGCTSPSLIDRLLDSALDPVLDDAVTRGKKQASRKKQPEPSKAIEAELLSVTVCDPACGSGEFLVAAARRIAKRLAAVREHDPEPAADALRRALRDVVQNCIYGVDRDDTAVELTKVSLRREAMEPGKALSFLDGHIKLGNSLIGATPKLIDGGIPDSAFKPAEGDDPKFARSLQRANVKPNPDQFTLFRDQAAVYQKRGDTDDYRFKRLIADAWCASFVWTKNPEAPPAIVNRSFRDLRERGADGILPATLAEIERLRGEYGFFHWHLEFPGIFRVRDGDPASYEAMGDDTTGWSGGFSCVLANPPWDKVDRRGDKAVFGFAGRSGAYPECVRGLTAPGVTTLQADQLFTERCVSLVAPHGRIGCVIPTAIATTAGAQYLFGGLARRGAVASLYDFENRASENRASENRASENRGSRFCLLTLTGAAVREPAASYAFSLPDPREPDPGEPDPREPDPGEPDPREPAAGELREDDRTFTLTAEEIALINPNTGSLPMLGGRRDAALTVAIYRHVPVLVNEARDDGNPWRMRLKAALLHATEGSGLLRTAEESRQEGWDLTGNVFTRDGKRMLPLYEPRMAHHFDHRRGSFHGTGNDDYDPLTQAEKRDPSVRAQPRYWVPEDGPVRASRRSKEVDLPGVSERLDELGWKWEWLCGWHKTCRPGDERTAIAAFLPRAAVAEAFPLMLPRAVPPLVACLLAAQSSLVFDFVSRQKLGGSSMRPDIWKQLPVPTPEMMERHLPFIVPRVLELVYTAHDMTPLARDLDDEGQPFVWDTGRRADLRAELDAFFFRVYGIDDRDDVDYILETFQTETGGLKHSDIGQYGTYRTKDLVLAAYDRMAAADAAAQPYETRLVPLPGHARRHPPASS